MSREVLSVNNKIRDSFRDEGKIQIFTVPNILSMFRICLIPIFIWMYFSGRIVTSVVLLVISGITDVVDGYIARHFNMISAVGKALDPIADKLTQAAMLFCLLSEFQTMWLPFLLLIFKEMFSGVAALIAIKRTGEVHGADWHGKLTTGSLYGMIVIHILWPGISPELSNILIGICVGFMALSLVLYLIRNIGMAKEAKEKGKKESTV